MYDLTTETEIREAVARLIEIDPRIVNVIALRPAYRSKQNVTVKVHESDGEKLAPLGKVKIGWVNCRIIERHTEEICYIYTESNATVRIEVSCASNAENLSTERQNV